MSSGTAWGLTHVALSNIISNSIFGFICASVEFMDWFWLVGGHLLQGGLVHVSNCYES